MRHVTQALLVTAVVLFPTLGYAQQLAGVVRDPSGAVLPGVTVEAASPVLIEKVRTTVTDGTGQYRITELRPGTYVLTFSLSGFTTVVRPDVQVSGAQIITINADMRVGGVKESITVTGETPVVDVQSSTRRQVVLDDAVIEALPASRGYGNLLATVPAIQATGLDSGANPVMNFFTAHGGRGNEGTIQIEGLNVGSAFNGGGVAGFGYDTANASEIQVTVVGGLGETDRGGPQFNMIPRTGGNTFSGTFFTSHAGDWSQGNNLDDELRGFGITEVPALIKNWDTSIGVGGPIVRDRVWFFGNFRTFGSHTDVAGLYGNANAGDPTQWSYSPDPNLKVRSANDKKIGAIRVTGQVTPKNKLGFYFDYQKNCTGSSYLADGEQCRQRGSDWTALGSLGGFGSSAPEAGNVWDDREKVIQGTWSAPATNRLLLEAGISTFISRWGGQEPAGALNDFIAVTELSARACEAVNPCPGGRTSGTLVPVPFFVYRGPTNFFGDFFGNDQQHTVWRASGSYVTGAHHMKVGYQAAYQKVLEHHFAATPQVSYLFFDGFPISLTQRIAPHQQSNRTRFDAFYVQDQWTRGRLTLQGALRYEHAWSWAPEGENGILAPSRFNQAPIIFPRLEGVKGYHDVTPRMGAAYDVFGNGRTSVKGSVSKYLQPANNEGNYTIANPAFTFVQTTSRGWFDANFDKVADCDLTNPGLSNECGPWANQNFGQASGATAVNPDVLEGSGVRPYDWQFSISIQQEVMPRVSAELSYNRRSWGNFFFTDNRAVGPGDFDAVTITAPLHAELTDGGGYPVTFNAIKDTKFGQFDNYYTFASDYGDVKYYWHGFDTNINARMANGLTFQGGTSTGRGVRDTCEITAALPEIQIPGFGATQQVEACSVTEEWLTSFRGLAAYTIPKIDVLVSAVLRSQANAQPGFTQDQVATNGASLSANYDVTSAQVLAAIGRPLAGFAATQTVDLLKPGVLYGERINSVDFRFAKVLRLGRSKSNVGLDLYNLFNSNAATGYNQGFGTNGATWLRPTAVLNPRFVRFNVTVDF